ncbi:hypothetical protein V1520DRAFT_339521 [Lipomyces starkeyi]|uniref:Zn(2)-C6 fungal-type domain-containing protein n=1 Tax=Lipomyces starkeyi NRRL Y-11557 TaxID=675824 RepID=A0A1E3Q0X0_LIPST|nr:hypothetical protein LIPSTDRAFT_29250 [Lipomyces starkeyi NRRL Y-11557]
MQGTSVRRSHTKSRAGCKTCKRRRVRCDELMPQCGNCSRHGCRCDFLDLVASSECNSWTQAILDWSAKSQEVIKEYPQLPVQFPVAFQELHGVDSAADSQFIHHVCRVTDELQRGGGYRLSFGTTELPLIMRLAVSHECVREAVMGLGATHLALATKNAEISELGYLHRGRAFHSLQDAINKISIKNVDAVLAASVVLSWQAPDPQTYMCLKRGIRSVLKAMESWNHISEMRDYFDDVAIIPSLIGDDLSDDAPEAPSNLLIDTSICSSLDRLRPLVADAPELRVSVQELYNFIQNQRIAPPGPSATSQLKALHPMRTWLHWMPTNFLRMSYHDPRVLLVMAHFEAVSIAVAPLFPAASAPNFVERRVRVVQRIDQVIRPFIVKHHRLTGHDLMLVPRRVALTYEPNVQLRLCQLPFIGPNSAE